MRTFLQLARIVTSILADTVVLAALMALACWGHA